MNVLHVFKTYLPDSFTGIERVIWEIAEGTAALGVRTDVLSLSADAPDLPMAIGSHLAHKAKLDFYLASTGLSLSAFGKFRQLAQQASIIHYHFPWPMMDLLHFVVRPRKPTIVTYHSDIVRQKVLLRFYDPIMRRFLASVDRIVATSPNYAESSAVLQRYAEKTSVIPIGLHDAPPPLVADVERWRSRVGDRFFLFVGVLRYYKGLPYLIEAAARTGLPVVIAGTGEMAAGIERTGLKNVQLVGGVTEADKAALLSLCSAFIFPSHLRSEAFGVALLEAARAGRPMISCEMGTGTSYVNLDGVTGVTVPPADPDALAWAMQLLWRDPTQTAHMGGRARERYEDLFTAERMAQSYVSIYQGLLR